MGFTIWQPLKKSKGLRNSLLLAIIASFGIFIALSIYADIGKVTQALAEFRWGYIPLILALTSLSYLLRFYKWHYYLGCIGVRIKWKDSLAIFLSGLAMTVTPAKLGEIYKSYLLKRLKGTEISRSIPVVFTERIADMLSLLILAAISFSALEHGLKVLIIILTILLTLIAILQSRPLSIKLLGALNKVPFIKRASASLIVAYESANTLFQWKTLLITVLIGMLSWWFICWGMYFVLVGFNIDGSMLLSTFVTSFSLLLGGISMIPGGLGVTEAGLAGLLMLSGISKGIAITATVIIRLCTLWFGEVVGLIAMLLTRRKIIVDNRKE